MTKLENNCRNKDVLFVFNLNVYSSRLTKLHISHYQSMNKTYLTNITYYTSYRLTRSSLKFTPVTCTFSLYYLDTLLLCTTANTSRYEVEPKLTKNSISIKCQNTES